MHRMSNLFSFALIAMVIMIVGLMTISTQTMYAAESKIEATAKPVQTGDMELLAAPDLVRCQSYSATTDRHGHDIFMCEHNHQRAYTLLAKWKFLQPNRSWPLLTPS